MTLLELYEELFQYVCRLNRVAKTQAHPEFATVRAEVRDLLSGITSNASTDIKLLNQVKKLEPPIVFFIDYIICASRLKFAAQWAERRMAGERNELAGDERFFVDFLEKDLADTSEEAVERLAVYYVCLGLGFMGMYQDKPEKIRSYMEQIYARIPQYVDRDPRSKISEEAYQHTDTEMLSEPPSKRIVMVIYAFVFLCLCVLVICYANYKSAVRGVENSTAEIIKQAGSH